METTVTDKTVISSYMAEIGKRGGQAKGLSKVRGTRDYYRRIALKGARIRRALARVD
jgi:hypothetical protein